MRGMKMRRLVLLMFLAMIPEVAATTINVNPGSCADMPSFSYLNVSDYLTYTFFNITICATKETCTVNATIPPGGSYDSVTNVCDVHIKAESESLCEIDDILANGSYYENNEGVCRVRLSAENITCPETLNEICSINATIYPEVGNVTYFENTTGSCSIHQKIEACPVCDQFKMPENYAMLHNDQIKQMIEQSEAGLKASQDAQVCAADLEKCKSEIDSVSNAGIGCGMSIAQMVDGYEALSNMEQNALSLFVRVNESVDMWGFSYILYPESESPQESAYYANWMLESYYSKGFATSECNTVHYEISNYNFTQCFYRPVLDENCLNMTIQMVKLKATGDTRGMINTLWIVGGVIAFCVILLVIVARKGMFPWR